MCRRIESMICAIDSDDEFRCHEAVTGACGIQAQHQQLQHGSLSPRDSLLDATSRLRGVTLLVDLAMCEVCYDSFVTWCQWYVVFDEQCDAVLSQDHQSDPKECHRPSGVPGRIGARSRARRGATVVDMTFDDTDQDEEVAMAGNRVAALSDHNSDRSEGGVRDIRPSRRLVLVSQPLDAVTREWGQTLKWGMWSNPQQRRFQS